MIDNKTLEKVKRAEDLLKDARMVIDDLLDIELERTGWMPGSGAKPHRVREAELMIRNIKLLEINLDRLWS